jgi:HAMP domain-containing protein/signal transduction histidine kinase/DNA-binding response OmpR family regulator
MSESVTTPAAGRNGPVLRKQVLNRISRARRASRSEPATGFDRRRLLAALAQFKRGDFEARLPEDWTGIDGKIADTFNEVVQINQRMASELERLSRVVGTEGKITQRATLGDVRGAWSASVESVNNLISDLVHPTRETARVIGAVAKGDLSQTMALETGDGRPLEGQFLRTAKTVNTMVDQLASFASEVTRVAREVGTEGKLGGQAKVKGVAGTWKDLTDSVNLMAGNLTAQVRNIATVTTAVANGDLTKKITVDVRGEILELKDTINTMVDQLRSFASEVTRVAREVGTEGKLGGQAYVQGVGGTWKDLTDNVNFMASNLTGQVRNIAAVTTAVANGDLTKKITVDVRGEILELKDTINTMVDQLSSFASEVTRVAREVGTEGKLGGQAEVKGVAGTWKDLTDSVNLMAGNLTGQVRNIAAVTTAVANGDLTKKITVDVRGEILELKDTINTMVDQLRSFASEVTRVAREVGTEGKLGGQAEVKGVAGTWKDLTDNVNFMASNLTGQVRNIADVTKAVANGDLSKKITVDVRGEILELKNTVNTMVDQLSSFAAEVTRVAREVGTEGKLGGQAEVKDVAGTWKDLTDSVNLMAGNLTAQVRNIAAVTTAVANGDLAKKITVDVRGEILELKDTINTMVDQLRSFASEVTRVAREVGTEGRLGGQARVEGVSGTWRDLTDSVNSMAGNLTAQVRNIADVTTAVANGDLAKKITVDVRGEILELKDTINTMVDQLSSFASEVTRVAREVGTEGKLGGQASVPGVSGTWKDLTDNVNSMAGNLTSQVRGIAKVVTAVANGDLQLTLTLDAKGEIAALADTINGMIATLATFADQVTTVAREVGVQGRLGGQASVPGAAGTWKDLTDNVNQLAANLTTQVRAIAEVATAVTKGDLTRSIKVEAQGEVAVLKDTINEMIRNLRDTTLKNSEQDWLKTNLAKFSRMLQGQRDLLTVGRLILSELAPVVSAQQAVFYTLDSSGEAQKLRLLASFATTPRAAEFDLGEGLIGQCAIENEKMLLSNVPPGYVEIASGLGAAAPLNLIVLPVVFERQVMAVLELASFDSFSPTHQAFLDDLMDTIGIVLNTIQANTRTEDLLRQSQSLAKELQSQQEVLQKTNQELEEKAGLLVEQNAEVERKNQEVEQARQALEEKAKQLALTSKYKSEFLANMSHELRTPLNSLLILSDQLSRNQEANLSPKETEFAKTIHSAGNELLRLINDILDLSKIESGTVVVETGEVRFKELADYVERTFRHVAAAKGLEFEINLDPRLPRAFVTDAKRLQQVIKNMLSNAFKFTEDGRVVLAIERVAAGWSPDQEILNRSRSVLSISVTDTGIGIPLDKQQIVFEPFQQADGSTTRKYGGTGLGLAISREISHLLGGEIRLQSSPGEGSKFTLYLPQTYAAPKAAGAASVSPAQAQAQAQAAAQAAADAAELREEHRARLAQMTHMGHPAADAGEAVDASDAAAPAVAGSGGGGGGELDDGEREALRHAQLMAAGEGVLGFADDRENVQPGDRVVLIVDNDENFGRFLLDLAREQGFKGILAVRGADAVALARERRPDAITLDISLPDLGGWRVFERLRADTATRHIPVYVITTEEDSGKAMRMGAIGLLNKPIKTRDALEAAFYCIRDAIDQPDKDLLVVGGRGALQPAMLELLSYGAARVHVAETGAAALERLDERRYACVVMVPEGVDPREMAELEELVRRCAERGVPALVYTPRAAPKRIERLLRKLGHLPVLRHVQSQERLVDQTALLLHRPVSELGAARRRMIEDLYETPAVLAGRKVLIVDDDIRNIFALTSVLERYDMEVLAAETGRGAISTLERTPGIDIVLMDIMMPDMDGYETIRSIRRSPRWKDLPIVAVTAKAMKGDREKTLEAGAWDYLAKPVDTEHMLAMLRGWLYR